jgi:anti-sigma regulatory factor (Ser/Thr protein kinase)
LNGIGSGYLRAVVATTDQEGSRGRWTVPAVASALRGVRQQVARWLDARDVPATTRDDTVLVVSELLTNAIDASADSDSTVRLQLASTAAGCRVTVSDQGPGFSSARSPDTPEGGRGLYVVRRLSTELNIEREPSGWTVVSALVAPPDRLIDGITRPGSVP